MTEILLPSRYQGGTRNPTGRKGPELRLAQVRKTFGYIPAWRCRNLAGHRFYLCGECFYAKGDGPVTSLSEFWEAGAIGGKIVPANARCANCHGPAWPKD